MTISEEAVVRIGVFVAEGGWLVTHPAVQSRFAVRDEALAAARRLAHLEAWRGREAEVFVQERLDARLGSAAYEGWAAL
jgi:hypothetical protein